MKRPSSLKKARSVKSENLFVLDTYLDKGRPVREALKKADLIIYCAGSVKGLSEKDFLQANVIALENIVTTAIDVMEDPKLVLISSLAAKEPDLSPYAYTKRLGERVVENAVGLKWVILRPTAVYGVGDKELLPILKLIKLGLGLSLGPIGQKLTFIHVEDCVQAILAVSRNFISCEGRIFECHDGKKGGYTWADIKNTLRGRLPSVSLRVPFWCLGILSKINMFGAKIFGYAPMLTSGKVNEIWHKEWICDNEQITSCTGWKPSRNLREGMELSQ